MNSRNPSSAFALTAISKTTETVNDAVLNAIAHAWKRFPSAVPVSPSGGDQKLLGQVLAMLAQEGLIRIEAGAIALTTGGYRAVEQAGRSDDRLGEFLQGGPLPAEGPGSSSLVLAILRAHVELRKGKGE